MLCMKVGWFHIHKQPHLLLSKKTPLLEVKERKLINPNPSSSSSSCWRVNAVKEKEDSGSESGRYDYEIEPEKAREALKKLDQQFQSLSSKQVSSPKLRASEVKFREAEKGRVDIREKGVEISESFLAYTAVALVLFTIFYNFLFYTVIAPSIDGP